MRLAVSPVQEGIKSAEQQGLLLSMQIPLNLRLSVQGVRACTTWSSILGLKGPWATVQAAASARCKWSMQFECEQETYPGYMEACRCFYSSDMSVWCSFA